MKRLGVLGVVTMLVAASFALSAVASNAELYFASDKNGQNRVTNIQEGTEVWIVVYDPDENIDCDVRDKFWTDVKVMDPKTGAYIVWVSYYNEIGDLGGDAYGTSDYDPYKGHYPGNSAGWLGADYFEETGADTGLFVSKRAFQVGTREDYDVPRMSTHVVDDSLYPGQDWPHDFQWGHYDYLNGERGWFDGTLQFQAGRMGPAWNAFPVWPDEAVRDEGSETEYLVGRFENMDTLIGMVQDQNDETDVAVAMMKIIDTEATITWDQEIYKDANTSATITVVDADENLNCNVVEYVPVFIIVNPGSWNPVQSNSPNSFCMLKRFGGVGNLDGDARDEPIRWWNIYNSEITDLGLDNEQEAVDGTYYMEYPVDGEGNVTSFDTAEEFGICRVMFYAQETGVNTGVFQLNLNSILGDLGFNSLRVRDVLVAYYLDPNDEDDFKLDAAYIEEKMHSITSFTDATRGDKDIYWIGRDPVYVQVIDANANVDPCCPEQVVVFICDPHQEDDAEWVILDETSSNSPVFFTNAGTELDPVWDAMGIGLPGEDGFGGYQLELDNWKLEVFNEDDVYARY
ncbi:hypothetical protein L0Y59_04885, partial [Candidatus Uhrbacteria bacterium]|nr:hypothetical protein [Candidatus Uhrbacteria bacterium]